MLVDALGVTVFIRRSSRLMPANWDSQKYRQCCLGRIPGCLANVMVQGSNLSRTGNLDKTELKRSSDESLFRGTDLPVKHPMLTGPGDRGALRALQLHKE